MSAPALYLVPVAEHEELLRRFAPRLVYDSQETFFADSAAEWTDNPSNVLRREPQTGAEPVILAAARPAAGEPQLSLDFLGELNYENGARAHPGDQISNSRSDYREQYARLRNPRYANVGYARAAKDRDGRVWLQYWLWYFYNDYTLAFGIGLHEGYWELVQLRMAEEGESPDLAVYAQHSHSEERPWDAVPKADGAPDTPLVYVARGSHSSYFEPGLHATDVWYDLADGRRPGPALRLEFFEDLSWSLWPGRWGDTRERLSKLESASPVSPCRHAHWDDPAALLDRAVTHSLSDPADPPDGVALGRRHGRLVVRWALAGRKPAVGAIVVNVNSPDEPGVAPRAYTFDVTLTPRGRVETAIELAPDRRYELHVSVVDANGVPSASRLALVEPGARSGLDWLRRLLRRCAAA